jgi:drug/metabolite transporter (DMT)-like permease
MCATFVLATTLTTAANAIILQYTAPAWVFLLSPLIVGDRTERGHWVAFAISMSAVALIFTAHLLDARTASADALGLTVGLASGLVFGCQGVLFRRVRRMDPVVMAFLSCGVSGVLLLPFALAIEGWQLTLQSAGYLVFMGSVQFGLPYVLYSAGVRHVSAQRTVLLIMLEPVLNPVWVFFARGEVPHWSTIIGGGLVVVSVGYLSLARTSRKA